MSQLLQKAFDYVDSQREEILSHWEKLVNMESGSSDKSGVDAVAAELYQWFSAEGGDMTLHRFEEAGNAISAIFGAERPGTPIVFMGHFDTVFKRGTVADRPFRIEDGKAYGPGVLDMKGGVVAALFTLKTLNHIGFSDRPIRLILAGDEEVGHAKSTMASVFVELSRGCLAAFNFETGDPDNRLVVGRKGSMTVRVEVTGVSVHAGREPEKGRSAILELAHKIIALQNLTDYDEGTTFNVGVVSGGTVSNAVPDRASAQVDIRFMDERLAENIQGRLEAELAHTYVPDTTTSVTYVGANKVSFLPMRKTRGNEQFFDHVCSVFKELGFAGSVPTAIVSGGGSDSAYSVLAGVPTIDQFGVKGQWNHSPREYAFVESIFERIKLAVASVVRLGEFEERYGE